MEANRECFGAAALCMEYRADDSDLHVRVTSEGVGGWFGLICGAADGMTGGDAWVFTVEEAPSNLAVIGRYVLDPAVFAVLARTRPGRGGEIQLTDALRELARMPAAEGGGVSGVLFDGRRYDTGDRLSYLQANILLALDRDDLGPALRAWLPTVLDSEGS